MSVASLTFVASAQDMDLSGRWTGTFNGKGRPVTLVLNLRVSDNQMTGELVDPGGNHMPIHDWKLEGNHFTFEVSAKEHGRPRTDHFVGVVEDDAIQTDRAQQSEVATTHSFPPRRRIERISQLAGT